MKYLTDLMIAEKTILKAEDLRIGNWVRLCADQSRLLQVTALPLGRLHSEWQVEADGSDRDFTHLEPIEITPEILEKAYELFHHEKGDLLADMVSDKQIQFVHQLQNFVYALTGQELEINL